MSARRLAVRTAAASMLVLLLPLAAQPPAANPTATPRISPAVAAVGMTVRDLDASIAFYRDVLRCRLLDRGEADGDEPERLLGVFGVHTLSARLALGDEVLELVQFLAPRGRALPEDSRANDRWFQHVAIVVRDMDLAYAELRRHHVDHSSPRPQTLPTWNPNAGGIRAFYFRDPDGHPLELLEFPPDKGAAKWHRAGDQLFLGIDHTAIVVADTDASLGFWRDQLGFAIAGTSDNHGIEQERLNNVFGAHLRITTLRGSGGPGVELLEYVTPRTGRPMPADSAANDLWQTTVRVTVDAIAPHQPALARTAALVSPAPVARRADGTTDGDTDGTVELLVRDPDGHRALLQQRTAPAAPAK